MKRLWAVGLLLVCVLAADVPRAAAQSATNQSIRKESWDWVYDERSLLRQGDALDNDGIEVTVRKLVWVLTQRRLPAWSRTRTIARLNNPQPDKVGAPLLGLGFDVGPLKRLISGLILWLDDRNAAGDALAAYQQRLDALERRVAELEAANRALRRDPAARR
jgi:hypothetical protein